MFDISRGPKCNICFNFFFFFNEGFPKGEIIVERGSSQHNHSTNDPEDQTYVNYGKKLDAVILQAVKDGLPTRKIKEKVVALMPDSNFSSPKGLNRFNQKVHR